MSWTPLMACSRNQDRVDQDVGTGAGISNRDHHARRRDVGELGDRQGFDRQPPQEQDDDRDDDRQCRSMEDFREHGSEIIFVSVPCRECPYREAVAIPRGFFGLQGPLPGVRNSYSTFSPSRTCRIPSRTILSSTSSPFLMTKMSSSSCWTTISR